MTVNEGCPNCDGKCCRDVVYGHHRTHWTANEYAHDCAFCHDGTVPVRTAEDERAAVVAYLRDCAHRDAYRNHNRNRAEALWDAANSVESGEHRREEEK